MSPRAQVGLGLVASAALLAWRRDLEAVSLVFYAWSVALLAANHVLGWWLGLVGVAGYGALFFEQRLFAEVGLQVVYFVTSLQAIWLWLRGGPRRTERPVTHAPRTWWAPTAVVVVLATAGLVHALTALRGAAPLWDAVVTVVSLVAHVALMLRLVESWYLWLVVDTIAVPLYASREWHLTSAMYAVFWVMALQGLLRFRREAATCPSA